MERYRGDGKDDAGHDPNYDQDNRQENQCVLHILLIALVFSSRPGCIARPSLSPSLTSASSAPVIRRRQRRLLSRECSDRVRLSGVRRSKSKVPPLRSWRGTSPSKIQSRTKT